MRIGGEIDSLSRRERESTKWEEKRRREGEGSKYLTRCKLEVVEEWNGYRIRGRKRR